MEEINYTPEDVLKYFEERSLADIHAFRYNIKMEFIEPEYIFNKDVLKKGLLLLKNKKISELKNELSYIKEVKLPKLEKELFNILN